MVPTNYPGKRPQTACGSARIMHDNVDDDDDDDDDDGGGDGDDDDDDDDDVEDDNVEEQDEQDDTVAKHEVEDNDVRKIRWRRFHNSNFVLKFRGKMPCASLRRRNALGHVTRATLCRNSQVKCQRPEPRRRLCASLRNRNASGNFTRTTL